MKNFFEKHEWFKICGIMFILVAILTWIIPAGYVAGNTIGEYGVYSTGGYTIVEALYYSLGYLSLSIILLLALAAFYGIASKTEGYKNIVARAVKALKGKETIFIVVVSVLIAICASVFSCVQVTLLFIPLIITIILKLNMDKLVAFSATFGSIIVGTMSYTYNVEGMGELLNAMSLKADEGIFIRIGIGVLALTLLNFFAVNHAKKVLGNKKAPENNDLFAIETVEEKTTKKDSKKIWPMVTILVALGVVTILGYIAWNNIFQLTFFDEMHKAVMEFKIGEDFFLFKNIIGGNAQAFGLWNQFGMIAILLIAAVIVKFVYKVKFDDALSNASEGVSKFGKIVALIIGANMIVLLMYMTPILPVILNWFLTLSDKFNPVFAFLGTSVSSMLYNEFGVYASNFGGYLAGIYPDSSVLMLSLVTAANGFVSFFAPTSFFLIVGLKYLDIPYGTWMKYIWKFLVGVLICILAIFLLVTYI